MLKGSMAATLVALLTAAAFGQTLPATDLPALVKQLGSDNFSQREAAQKQLDNIPASQIDVMRKLAAATSDSEVKGRLELRLAAMEIYILTHPPGLTLNLTNATLAQVAAALRTQLGPTVLIETSNTPIIPYDWVAPSKSATKPAAPLPDVNPLFTLHVQNAPFWQIMDQLNRQSPLYIQTDKGQMPEGYVTGLRLQPLHPDVTPTAYTITDTFAYSATIVGTRGGKLQVRTRICADPRVLYACSTGVSVVKSFTDQDGHDLTPNALADTYSYIPFRPMYAWNSCANFLDKPGLRRIKEFRGTTVISLVEHRRTLLYDLTLPPPGETVPTPRGPLTLTKDPLGYSVLTITPSDNMWKDMKYRAMITVNGYDADGVNCGERSTTDRSPFNWVMDRGRIPVKLHISWPDKVQDYVFPIEIKDLEVPENPRPLETGSA